MERVTTIITCMTDAERPFLVEALRSVQKQTVATKIIVCVADDNQWADEIIATVQPGVELMRLGRAWTSSIRNQAISAVNSELVAFLDSDDLWEPTKLQTQLDALDVLGLDVVGAQHVLIREDGVPFFFGFALRIPMTSSWLGKTAVFRKHPFELVQFFEDVLLWEYLESEVRLGILDAFLVRYRVREVSASSATATKNRKLAYARRSQIPGVRPLLLCTSYAANIGFQLRRRVLAQQDNHVRPSRPMPYK